MSPTAEGEITAFCGGCVGVSLSDKKSGVWRWSNRLELEMATPKDQSLGIWARRTRN